MSVLDEKWTARGGGAIRFPDGDVDLHTDGEPEQIVTETKVILHCEERASLAALAPDMARLILSGEWTSSECERIRAELRALKARGER